MAKKDQVVDIPEKDENISEIDVSAEMRGSFLEYAVSVIYARALPDARDGLKPVQRRILFQMARSWVSSTRTAIPRFTRPWCASLSPLICGCRWSMVTVTLVLWMMARLPLVTRRRAWRPPLWTW